MGSALIILIVLVLGVSLTSYLVRCPVRGGRLSCCLTRRHVGMHYDWAEMCSWGIDPHGASSQEDDYGHYGPLPPVNNLSEYLARPQKIEKLNEADMRDMLQAGDTIDDEAHATSRSVVTSAMSYAHGKGQTCARETFAAALAPIVSAVTALPLGEGARIRVGYGRRALQVMGADDDTIDITREMGGVMVSAKMDSGPPFQPMPVSSADGCELAAIADALVALGGDNPQVFMGFGAAPTEYLMRLGAKARITNGAMVMVRGVRFHSFA